MTHNCSTSPEIPLNHLFVDGNIWTGFLATYVFMSPNVLAVAAREVVVSIMQAVASGTLSESGLAAWLTTHAATAKQP